MVKETLELESDLLPIVLGERHRVLRELKDALDLKVFARDGSITLEGEAPAVERGLAILRELAAIARRGGSIAGYQAGDLIRGRAAPASEFLRLPTFLPRRFVVPRTPGQQRYLELARANDLTICIGPAGTGKTYLAVALVAAALKEKALDRIILVRPALEAGEKLGYLPGDIQAKVNPFLRPLYDALADVMEPARMRKFIEHEVIEIAPLAYMRGRTLDRAGIILDEAQNCTTRQMKMFLTRLGRQSRCIITGDVTQIDLPPGKVSGLVDVRQRLEGVSRIAVVELGLEDVVRHRLVRDIVRAYGQEPEEGPEPAPANAL